MFPAQRVRNRGFISPVQATVSPACRGIFVSEFFLRNGFLKAAVTPQENGADMSRNVAIHNSVQNVHAAANAGHVVVADVIAPARTLRPMDGKSKRQYRSPGVGLVCADSRDGRRESLRSLSSCLEATCRPSTTTFACSIRPAQELPAPAWASLLLSKSLSN